MKASAFPKTSTKDSDMPMLDKYPHRIGKDDDHILYRSEIEYRCDEAKVLHVVAAMFHEPEAVCHMHKKYMNTDLKLANG